ncbi:MAG TPA: cbb3-type cytochrome c oxidase subunit I, partial [Gemmatimonadaceae bacterium]
DRRPLANAPAFYFILGSVVLEQVGAGILGFSMTFALTNVWSHGTLITPSHAHLALFGTFGMLGLGAAYFAVASMRDIPNFDQRLGKVAFWLVFIGMLGMTFSFALGGTVQIFDYRILGLDWFGGDILRAVTPFGVLLLLFAFVFTIGAAIVAFDLFTLGARVRSPAGDAHHQHVTAKSGEPALGAVPARVPTGWARPLTGYEAAVWLLGMWIFGGIITLGLLSFNLESVRLGDPHIPYIMAGTGYPGLLLVTLLFVWRFLASLEARVRYPDNAVGAHAHHSDVGLAAGAVGT